MLILTRRKPEYYQEILKSSTRQDWKDWLQYEFSPENREPGLGEHESVLDEWYVCMMTDLTDDVPTETIIDLVNMVLAIRYDTMLDPNSENWERPIFYQTGIFLQN